MVDATVGGEPRPVGPVHRWREIAAVLAFFVLVLCAGFVRVGFDPVHNHPGGGFSKVNWHLVDWNVHYWNLWEFHRVWAGEASLLHTDSQFHPTGLDTLSLHGDLLLKAIGGLVALVAPPDVVHLAIVLLVFLGNAMGGYVLVRSLTGSRAAGLVVGLLFCFSGAAAWAVNTGNLEYGLWLWVCLYLTFLDRVLRQGRWPDVVAAVLFAVLSVASNLAFFHNLVLLSAVPLVASVKGLDRRRWAAVAAVGVGTAVLLLPLAFAFARGDGGVEPSAGDKVTEAFGDADLPVAARNSYPISEYLPWRRGPLKEDSSTPFIAWALLVMSLVVARQRALPWCFAALVFFLLALGPYVRWGPRWTETRVPGPFLAAQHVIPLYENVRFPHRIFAFAVLSAGVAVGYAVERSARSGRDGARRWAPAVIVALVLVESVAQWGLRSSPKQPVNPFYEQIAAETGSFAMVELPLDFGVLDCRYLFFQTRHGKPLFNGTIPLYFDRRTAPNRNVLEGNALLNRAYQLQRPLLPRHIRRTLPDVPPTAGRPTEEAPPNRVGTRSRGDPAP